MDKTNYWFKRRRYGWGWIPVTWQGWTVLGVFIVFAVGLAPLIQGDQTDDVWDASTWLYLTTVIFLAIILVLLSYKFAPRPKWRWGKKHDDNPDEDF